MWLCEIYHKSRVHTVSVVEIWVEIVVIIYRGYNVGDDVCPLNKYLDVLELSDEFRDKSNRDILTALRKRNQAMSSVNVDARYVWSLEL